MSHFSQIRTRIADQGVLLLALADLGFGRGKLSLHEDAVALSGYLGDKRSQKAHIVIPRSHVGQASNDIGFERQADGTYRIWISDFDQRQRYGKSWVDRLMVRYAYHATVGSLEAQGFSLTEEKSEGGQVQIVMQRVS